MIAIKFDEIIDVKGKPIADAKTYPGIGVYLADDGSSYFIVRVEPESFVTFTVIPRDMIILTECTEPEKTSEHQKLLDTLDDISNKVSTSLGVSTKLLNKLDKGSQATDKSSQSIDLGELVKLVAVSQKPDLYKEQ